MTKQGNELETSRREFLQAGTSAAAIALQPSLEGTPAGGAANRRLNIVMFLGEGQRTDALSLAGNPILKTPNHDRIGQEGVYFRNAFVTNALCAPARAVTMTGCTHATGALANEDRPGETKNLYGDPGHGDLARSL